MDRDSLASDTALPKHFMNNARHQLKDSVKNEASYFLISFKTRVASHLLIHNSRHCSRVPDAKVLQCRLLEQALIQHVQRNAKLRGWQCFTLRLRNWHRRLELNSKAIYAESNYNTVVLQVLLRYNPRAVPKLDLRILKQIETAV